MKALGRSTDYLAALPDLEAALTWAREQGYRKIVVWGSSYASALVFLLAAKHPEIAGVLSFSPGEYLDGERTVRDAAARVRVPSFVTSAGTPEEVAQAHPIFQAVAARDRVEFEPAQPGVHGSLALSVGDPQGQASYWKAVLAFLARFR